VKFFGPHPATIAFMLGGGAAMALYSGFQLFLTGSGSGNFKFNQDLSDTSLWLLLIIGCVLWLAGGIIFGRGRNFHWLVALLLHLVPVIGLVVMFFIRKPLTPHQVWERGSREIDPVTAKRTQREMKALY
jgi:hypothetical protein